MNVDTIPYNRSVGGKRLPYKADPNQFFWNTQRRKTAVMVAEDRYEDTYIRQKCDVSFTTFYRWKSHPIFQSYVAELREKWKQKIEKEGIADRLNRIKRLNETRNKLLQVIDDRAEKTERDVPGASTGLIVKECTPVKIGDTVHMRIRSYVDNETLAMINATEKQAAQELGQWTESNDKGSHVNILVNVDTSDLANMIREAESMLQLPAGTQVIEIPADSAPSE